MSPISLSRKETGSSMRFLKACFGTTSCIPSTPPFACYTGTECGIWGAPPQNCIILAISFLPKCWRLFLWYRITSSYVTGTWRFTRKATRLIGPTIIKLVNRAVFFTSLMSRDVPVRSLLERLQGVMIYFLMKNSSSKGSGIVHLMSFAGKVSNVKKRHKVLLGEELQSQDATGLTYIICWRFIPDLTRARNMQSVGSGFWAWETSGGFHENFSSLMISLDWHTNL